MTATRIDRGQYLLDSGDMWRFVLKENIRRFEALLLEERSPAERATVLELLARAKAELAELDGASTAEFGRRSPEIRRIAEQSVEDAMRLHGAQFGNLQVYDETRGGLIIVAQVNFRSEFLNHFALVKPADGSACARALGDGGQTVVADVNVDPDFEPHRRVAYEAGFRAVLSSPLRAPSGKLIGVLSTHFSAPRTFSPDELDKTARLAASVAAALGHRLTAEDGDPGALPEGWPAG